MRRISCIVLIVLTILALNAQVFAAHSDFYGPITPQFTHISHISSRLSISAWGEADCSGSVALYSSSNTAALTMELQRQDSNGWSTIKYWTSSAPGLSGVYMERYHWVVRGTYRLLCTARAYSASGALLEEASILSREITY